MGQFQSSDQINAGVVGHDETFGQTFFKEFLDFFKVRLCFINMNHESNSKVINES